MNEPSSDAPSGAVGRCPSCGARVVPEQDWCSLCLKPLRAPDPAPHPGPVSDPGTSAAGEPDLSADDPYAAMQPPDALAPHGTLPPGVAEAMLAELAATTAADRPLAGGPLAGTSRRARLALGCGAALVLALVLVGLLALIGLVL